MTICSLDFETFSTAGFHFDDGRWRSVAGSQQGGIKAVGAAVYAEHPSTEVLIACYSFEGGPFEGGGSFEGGSFEGGGSGPMRTWVHGMPDPVDLLEHVRNGGIVQAWNSVFEWLIWDRVCVPKYGWPKLLLVNTLDTMASARAYGLPGTLARAAKALGAAEQKDTTGKSLIRRFSIPRSPTKKNQSLRTHLGDDPEKALLFYRYCAQDVRTESGIADQVPPLSPVELDVWKLDQEINERGVSVDMEALENCRAIVAGISERLTAELVRLTNGVVTSSGQVAKIQTMFAQYGIPMADMQAETVEATLADAAHPVHSHPWAKRVLEIRRDLASASVKKLEAISRRMCADGRLRGLFAYAGAERTGRWAGRGPQPHNLPRGDADVAKCTECGVRQKSPVPGAACVECWGPLESAKWNFPTALEALESFRDRDVDGAVNRWGDVLSVIAGCLRSLFVSAPGHRFICSDYRAIEAVVLAALAGEEWRLEVFRGHGKIYETSASKITGIPLEEYLEYKRKTGEHHPHRQKIGKVAELACFGSETELLTDSGWKRIIDVTTDDRLHDGVEWITHGGVVSRGVRKTMTLGGVKVTPDHKFYRWGSWKTAAQLAPIFGGEMDSGSREVFDVINAGPRSRFVVRTDDPYEHLIAHNSGYQGGIGAWKNFGAGDHMTDDEIKLNVKRWRQESPMIVRMWYGIERAAISAIENQGNASTYRGITYHCDGRVLRCVLPSGRPLVYHTPTVEPGTTPWGAPCQKIHFWGWNSNPKHGPIGWIKQQSYGGRLVENVVQAASRDILAHGMLNAARAGYRIVLHVHDEIVCEQPEGTGSVEELERLMGELPAWASGWPVIAQGGWAGIQYRKD